MRKYVKSINRKGFTLIEVLLAMFVISISLLLIVPCVQVMGKLSATTYASEDAIAIRQLRMMLAESEDVKIAGDTLQFILHNEAQSLSFQKKRLVKRKGYLIYLKDIDTVSFVMKGGCIDASWSRKDKQKNALLYCE